MLISLCLPVHNRLNDLQAALPTMIEEAEKATPFEIAIVNYASPDRLHHYLYNLIEAQTDNGVMLTTRRYVARTYFHMAHSRNLSVLASHGDYIIIWSADLVPTEDFFFYVRAEIEKYWPIWAHPTGEQEIIICKRQEFIDAGGYDERFEFYGPEGKDLHARLTRRNGRAMILPFKPFKKIIASDNHRFDNYRLKISKGQMGKIGKKILDENNRAGITVANKTGWGAWS